METALHVEGVAKQYRIYERPSDRLAESLTRGWVRRHREFWALRGVSFAVGRGETVGVVGPNGSGKSTLLQIVTGTLEPTHGEVFVEGRVAALLELGAGFDPEFTGLENVFMNTALLGWSRRETERRLPEIERFAEIGDFIRQPVKTYSSGMFVRLAFAVAVHTDPEILVIDEALSVGDTIFQHRCLRRIREMQAAGTTVLFVSHEPTLVRALCSRAILLSAGRMLADGAPADVLNRYQRLIMAREEAYEEAEQAAEHDETDDETHDDLRATGEAFAVPALEDAADRSAADRSATDQSLVQSSAPGSTAVSPVEASPDQSAAAGGRSSRESGRATGAGRVRAARGGKGRARLTYSYRHGDRRAEIVAVELLDARGEPAEMVESGEAVVLRVRVLFHADVEQPVCGFMIRNRHGINVYGTNTEQRGLPLGPARAGDVLEAEFSFNCWLGQEHYFVSAAAHTPDGVAFDWMDGVVFFRVACATEMEGLANLNAHAAARRVSRATTTTRGASASGDLSATDAARAGTNA